MDKVYVLFGETGEYSDRQEWVVRAYANEDAANAERDKLNALAVGGGSGSTYDDRQVVRMRLLPHDANASVEYTGTSYSVTEVPFIA